MFILAQIYMHDNMHIIVGPTWIEMAGIERKPAQNQVCHDKKFYDDKCNYFELFRLLILLASHLKLWPCLGAVL